MTAGNGPWTTVQNKTDAVSASMTQTIDAGRATRVHDLAWQLLMAPACWIGAAVYPALRPLLLGVAMGLGAAFVSGFYRTHGPRLRLVDKLVSGMGSPGPDASRALVRYRRVVVGGQVAHVVSLIVSVALFGLLVVSPLAGA